MVKAIDSHHSTNIIHKTTSVSRTINILWIKFKMMTRYYGRHLHDCIILLRSHTTSYSVTCYWKASTKPGEWAVMYIRVSILSLFPRLSDWNLELFWRRCIYICVLLACKQSLKSNIFQNIIVPCHIYWFHKCIVAGYFKKNNGLAIVQEIYKS